MSSWLFDVNSGIDFDIIVKIDDKDQGIAIEVFA